MTSPDLLNNNAMLWWWSKDLVNANEKIFMKGKNVQKKLIRLRMSESESKNF